MPSKAAKMVEQIKENVFRIQKYKTIFKITLNEYPEPNVYNTRRNKYKNIDRLSQFISSKNSEIFKIILIF